MNRNFVFVLIAICIGASVKAQSVKSKAIPAIVQKEFKTRYPEAKGVAWEREDGGYEANWGGKSGEDNSALFTANGKFVQIVKAIPVSALPAEAKEYVASHYKGKKITEAGSVTKADNEHFYEAEVKGKDLQFDDKGHFVKITD